VTQNESTDRPENERAGNSLSSEQIFAIRTNPPLNMSEAECSIYIGCSPRTLRNWRNARRIPFVKVAGKIIYRRPQVDSALERLEVKAV
jgi:DNA-binding transcriptional regulator YiaG